MSFLKRLSLLLVFSFVSLQIASLAVDSKPNISVKPYKRDALQDIVTWDSSSIFVRGKRILFCMCFEEFFFPNLYPILEW